MENKQSGGQYIMLDRTINHLNAAQTLIHVLKLCVGVSFGSFSLQISILKI